MKNFMISTVVAASSLLAISACAHDNNAMNNAHYQNMAQHHGQMQNHHGQRGHMMQGQMGQRMGVGMQNMMSQLNLTTTQRTQMQSIMQNNATDYNQKRAAMMQILTPEQLQQMNQMQSQHMNNRGHMMNQGHQMNQGHMMSQ